MSKKTHLRSLKVLGLDRALSGGMGRQILIYILIVLFTFLVLFGVARLCHVDLTSDTLPDKDFSDLWKMLFFFYDGGLEASNANNHWFVYLANILGSILMGGILIATFTNYLQSNRDKAEKGLLRYRLSDHSVFIGIHESMFPLVRTALAGKKGFVVILSELPISEAKDRIVSGLKGSIDTDRLIVYHGQRTNPDDLASLCLDNTKEVFIFPEMSFPDTDSVNLDVVEKISNLRSAKDGKKLKCTAIFQQDSVVACFERSDIDEEVKKKLDFWPIVYGEAVTQALLSGKVYGNGFLDERVRENIRENITLDSNKRVHLFIIGLGNIGRALFVQAARQLHFPNFEKVKSVITLVGEQSDIDALKARYREFFAVVDHAERYAYLGDFLDLSIEIIPASDAQGLDVALNRATGNPNELVTVAICLENSVEAQAKAISLPRCVYEEKVPVWLYKPDSDSLIKLIKTKNPDTDADSFYSNFVIFGNSENLFKDEEKQSQAQRIHEVYRAYSKETWNKLPPEWNDLPIRDKWSNLNCAYSIPIKLRSFSICPADTKNLTEEQVNAIARVEHNRWVADKLLGGFRPPTIDEREQIKQDSKLKKIYQEKLVHVDLCSNDDLLNNAQEIDKAIINNIHLIES